MMIHHSESQSLTDLVLQTDEEGNPQILDRYWNPIRTKEDLHAYWPAGWRNLKSIVCAIEKAMESELFFTRAIRALA